MASRNLDRPLANLVRSLGLPFLLGVAPSAAAQCPTYGAATPSAACGAPLIGCNSIPDPGNSGFAVTLANAPPGVASFLLVGFSPQVPPLPCQAFVPGCTSPGFPPCPLLINVLPQLVLPAPTSGAGPCGATAQVALPIPLDVSLCGGSAFLQWLVGDPGGCGTPGPPPALFTASQGLQVTICPSGPPFIVTGLNVAPGAVVPLNGSIRLAFSQAVDPSTVGFNSILFTSSSGAPVTGTFFVDPCSGGTEVVFRPACPTDPSFANGGLQPGAVIYTLTVPSGPGPGVIRSLSGTPLSSGASVSFRTPLPPGEPLFVDSSPATPPLVLGSVLPNPVPLNKLADPLDSVLVVFDQSIHPSPANLSPPGGPAVRLEFEEPPGSGTFVPIPGSATLVANCFPEISVCPNGDRSAVAVVPTGILPQGRVVRLVVKAGLADIGQVQTVPADVVVATSVVASSASAFPFEGDAFHEEFDTTEREDRSAPFLEPFAEWGGGVLRAKAPFPGPASVFDWTVPAGAPVIVDTTFDVIVNSTGQQLTVVGGVVNLQNLTVPTGSQIVGQGPNPLTIQATGSIIVAGEIRVDGINALNTGGLNAPYIPQPGAPGTCGGGDGGTASPSTVGSDVQGTDGFGPGNTPSGGGRGGHSSLGTGPAELRRGGGGGGGVLLLQASTPGFPSPLGLNGANGGPGPTGVGDCVDFALPVNGGLRGPDVFVDALLANDFFGRAFVPGGSPMLGELSSPIAGQGGGAGGDAVFYSAATPSPNCLNNPQWNGNPGDRKGGAGGGGGGILVLRALGPIVVQGTGRLSARGGSGGHGESILFINPAGGGGGGGSGGMILVESADTNPTGGIRLEGTGTRLDLRGGSGGLGVDGVYLPNTVCRGGEGGAGLVQLHSSRLNALGEPLVSVNGVDATAVTTPTVQPPGSARVLLPEFGSRSRARSKWIDTGFANLGFAGGPFYLWAFSGANDPSNPGYPLDGAGFVRTAGGFVAGGPILSIGNVPVGSVAANLAAVPLAQVLASGLSGPEGFARYELNPNTGQAGTFTVVAAAAIGTTVFLQTDPVDGSMLSILPPSGLTPVAIRPTYFLVRTGGFDGSLPAGAAIQMLFEGADAIAPSVAGSTGLGPALAALAGKRFVRAEFLFDLTGFGPPSPALPRPEVEFFKLPIRF